MLNAAEAWSDDGHKVESKELVGDVVCKGSRGTGSSYREMRAAGTMSEVDRLGAGGAGE